MLRVGRGGGGGVGKLFQLMQEFKNRIFVRFCIYLYSTWTTHSQMRPVFFFNDYLNNRHLPSLLPSSILIFTLARPFRHSMVHKSIFFFMAKLKNYPDVEFPRIYKLNYFKFSHIIFGTRTDLRTLY